MREKLKNCQRIVVKAGTSILSDADGKISKVRIARLGRELLGLLGLKKQVVLVSSGAIACGMASFGLQKRPAEMRKLQACAAIGQGKLMHAYERFFSTRNIHTAQVLLTRDGLEARKRFLAARDTLEELLAMNALPIINENDTVATEEIAFGDNDILSVHAAHLISADLLILLSDVDGFYLTDGSRVREVDGLGEIDQNLVPHLNDVRKEKNVGGMKAKLEAAKVAMKLGIPLMLVSGGKNGILKDVIEGRDVGTLFVSSGEYKNSRKKWIAFSAERKGTLMVDDGAHDALVLKKKSLLPSGIRKIRGSFERGDVVEVALLSGQVFGRGIVRYSNKDIQRIAGSKSSEIEKILGFSGQHEAIHRNDMVLWA
ncbi:MAG: glutamate 5-kinase [Omnitrophica bacterium GWA2_52_8]|nr:MAG: glutamate 5-kinase [Omnitrophica bacterium GWA2_52_8]